MKTIKMNVDAFIKISDNPAQRDTERHARVAKNKHLSELAETHQVVAIAEVGIKKTRYKVDGHTRALLWHLKELERPNELTVQIYSVANMKALVMLYNQFDNAGATESANDKMSGAMRFHKVNCQNPALIANCGLKNALSHLIAIAFNKPTHARNVNKKFSEMELVGEFKKEIGWLAAQSWQASKKKAQQGPGVPSVVAACVIITLRIDGNSSLAFWDAYYHDLGEKDKGGRDGVQMAVDWVIHCRDVGQLGPREFYYRNMEFLLNAYFLWKDKKRATKNTALYNKAGIKLDQMQTWVMTDLNFKIKTLKPPVAKIHAVS